MKKYSSIKATITGMVILLLGTSVIPCIDGNIGLNNVSNFETVNNMNDPPEWAMGIFNSTFFNKYSIYKGGEKKKTS